MVFWEDEIYSENNLMPKKLLSLEKKLLSLEKKLLSLGNKLGLPVEN